MSHCVSRNFKDLPPISDLQDVLVGSWMFFLFIHHPQKPGIQRCRAAAGGLQAAPELNGKLAECGELELTSQRYSARHTGDDPLGWHWDRIFCRLTCHWWRSPSLKLRFTILCSLLNSRIPGDDFVAAYFRTPDSPDRSECRAYDSAKVTLADGKETIKKVKDC